MGKFPTKTAILVSGIVVALVLFLILNLFVVISAGKRGIILNWGAVSDNIMGEGIHFRIPIKQKIEKLDVRTQKEQVDANAASKDLQTVSSTVALNYHLDPLKVNLLWQKIGADYKERIIDPAVQEAVKATTAKYTAEELITKREAVKEDIKKVLSERLQNEYILVDEFSIINFNFSLSFNAAIEAKQTAVQQALQAENDLRRIKVEAEQRVAQATAEAQAIKIQAEAITQQGGQDYVQLKAIEKWNGILPAQFIPGSAIPFLNLVK
jgi:regulator of protease activity HflC (stomatin/prohibitin superfamily)